jgi:uncharacterized protein (TIGR00369 family)
MERKGMFWDAVAGKVPPPPCARLLGWKAIDVQPGRVKIGFEAREEFLNPAGTVQGGFLAAMLDDTMGPAVVSSLGPGLFATTLEIKVSYVRPAHVGPLVAEGRVVHKGRSVAFLEGTLSAQDGELIATASATARIVPFEEPSPAE